MLLLLLTACGTDTGIIKADPPGAPVVSIQPTTPGTDDDLVVSIDVAAEDPSGGEVHYTYGWTRDGAATDLDGPTVDAAETTRGEVWAVAVTAVGELQEGGTGTASVVIGNSAPRAVTVVVDPDPAMTNDLLTATATGEDPDGDPLSWTWTWTVDGVLAGGGTNTLDGTVAFSRDQEVVALATPTDGTDAGLALASDPLVIDNSPPGAPALGVDPAEPLAGDDLWCVVTTPSVDADGDPVTPVFTWDVDGTPFAGATTTLSPGDTVAGAETAAGEVWTCTVTPDDGTDVGTPASVSVTIGEGPSSACPDPDGNCALRFDGLNDYVSVPDDPTLDGGGRPLTVEAWVWYDSLSTGCMTAVRKGTSSSPTYDYWLHKNISPGDSLYWGSWTGFTVVTFSAVTAGAWYHYAGVYDPTAGEARTYINGVELASSTLAGTPTANDEDLRIGIDWDFGCPTLGVIDEVRLSSVVRYTADFLPDVHFTTDADTMALYHFDTYEGTVAVDESGNGNDGTIVGASWTTEHP